MQLDFDGFMKNPMEHVKFLYTRKRETNPRYTLRAYARDLGVSQTLLSFLLTGKRPVSIKQGLKLYEYYRKSTPGAPPIDVQVFDLDIDHEALLRQWYHLPVLELAPLELYRGDPHKLATALGITPIEVEQAIRRLIRVELLEKKKDGSYRKVHLHQFFEIKQPRASVRTFHRKLLEKASEAMEREDGASYAMRDITSHIIVSNPDQIEEARKRIRKFQKSLIRFLTQTKGETVFQLGIQLFPISQPPQKTGNKI